MKNRYLVVNSNGEVSSPEEFIKNSECSDEFRLLLQREVLGEQPASVVGKEKDKDLQNRDYLYYANKLGFKWEPNSSIGFVQYNNKADLIMRHVQEYARQLVGEIGLPIYEVKGSNFFDLDHPVVEAYAQLFGDRLFINRDHDKSLVMSYDASYPQFNIAAASSINSRSMPFAHFSLSDCYRYEQSGECMLLYRGRRFFMPDLHPYLRSVDEAFEWYAKIEEKILESVAVGNREYHNIAKVSSELNWEKYKSQIVDIAIRRERPMLVEIRQDKAERYWIIDVDFSIVDSFSQVREIACIQIDIGNASRLGIEYFDEKGCKQNPVIIHAAVPGGIERYIYMLLDNYKQSFPIWLHPVQLRIIPVSDSHLASVSLFVEKMANYNVRIEIDDRSDSVSKRIKSAHEALIPNVVVFGDKEVADSRGVVKLVRGIHKAGVNYPFIKFSWPKELSRQIVVE